MTAPGYKRRVWTPDEAALVDLMLQDGASVVTIARKTQRSIVAIYNHKRGAIRQTRARHVWSAIEVARLFGVSSATVRTWIARKWLRAVRNNAKAHRMGQPSRGPVKYLIHDEAIWNIITRRETWPAWEPRFMSDPEWRDAAEEVRASAGGRWLTSAEMAAQLNYSTNTVKHWRRRGQLECIATVTYDGRFYYWSADLDGWTPKGRRQYE